MGVTQDGGGAVRTKSFPVSWDIVAKPCDYCKSAAALLFCRDESAFICISCDAKVHHVNQKHARVWMCEVCEQAPAVVTCKADAASLCLTCDRDIHSANPLARRHDRTPIVPFHDTAESLVLKSAVDNLMVPIHNSTNTNNNIAQNDYLTTTDSWIPTNNSIMTTKLSDDAPDIKSVEFLFSDSDQFLDFENYQISSHPFSDSVVPVQTVIKPPVPAHSTNDNSSGNRFEIDFTRSNLNSYNNSYTNTNTTASSLSHSVSSSSMEVGIVPDGSAMSDISYPFARNMGSIVDLSANQSFPVVGLDREARVLRYREKRKNRKFQKTIRYASRKAYAETRPRIKGRFAKRADGEPDIDEMFVSGSANFICNARYGVVPTF